MFAFLISPSSAGGPYFNVSAVRCSIVSVRRAKLGVLIGPDFSDLGTGPTNNCRALEKVLKRVDPSWSINCLTGPDATKAAILAAIEELVQRANAAPVAEGFDGDKVAPVVLLYFAGHAGQSGTEQYLQPYSSTPMHSQVPVFPPKAIISSS